MSDKPKTWSDYEALARDEPRLRHLGRIRLIELLFESDSTVAIRAAEMVFQMSPVRVEDEFSDVPMLVLEETRKRAREYILQQAASANGGQYDDD